MMETKENPLLHEVKKQLYHVKENSIRTAEDKIGNLVETTLNGSEGGKDKPVTDVDAQSIAYAEEKAKNLAKKVRTYQRKKAARQQKEVQTEAKVTAEADIRQRNSMETLKSSEASQPTPKSTLRSSFSDEKKPLDMKLHIGETAPKLKTESIKLSCTSGEKCTEACLCGR